MIEKNSFFSQFQRLEKLYNNGKPLDSLVREEYYKVLKFFHPSVYHRAIDEVIKSHHPYGGNAFPSLATILDVINDMGDRFVDESVQDSDVCQRCENIGIYLDVKGQSHFCQCKYGDRKKAVFMVKGFDKDKYREAYNTVKSDSPVVKGLKEWNPDGFWEDTQEEHDLWMAEKRKHIEEIKKRKETILKIDSLIDETVKEIKKAKESRLKEVDDSGL